MNSALAPEALCPACRTEAVSAYVYGGSYGVRCFACEWQAPVTSWIAVAPRLPGRIRADLVNTAGTIIRNVARGRGAEIQAAVSFAARDGGLVKLLGEASDA